MKKFVSVFSALASYLSKISGILLMLLSITVCLHVVMRSIFNSGILGVYELVQYGMLTIVSLTLAENEISGGSIVVNFILDKMKPRVANVFSIFMYLLMIIGMSVLLYNQIGMVSQKYKNGNITSVLGLPHWILVIIMCIGLFFFIIAFIIRVYNMISGHKHLVNIKTSLDEIAASKQITSEF